jgi:tight junction protein 4 (peripheral)
MHLEQAQIICLSTLQRLNCEDAPSSNESTKLIRVPMPTFPPTAMVYSINNHTKGDYEKKNVTNDTVPMNLIKCI